MFATAFCAVILSLPSPAQAAALPDTPQGRQVAAYLEAFNTGDAKKYLAMQDAHLQPDLLKKRSADQRLKMFDRMRGDFGTLKVSQVLKASAEEIQLAIADKQGTLATFTFQFDKAAPFKIGGIAVEIDDGGGG